VTERSVACAPCYLESDRPRNDLWLQVGSDDQAKVYLNGQQIYQFRLTCVAFAPDGRTVISGSRDSTALVWDVTAFCKP
jgi:WD40 repeat protein